MHAHSRPERPRVISLCAGYGGIDLALRIIFPGAVTTHYVERETSPARILASRMADGSIEPAEIFSDLTKLDGHPYRGRIDILTAGFPCQPWSVAGKRDGTDDERWIWPDIARLVAQIRPSIAFMENVPGLVSGGGLEPVLGDLAAIGYDAFWLPLSAADMGASHIRERVFILAFDPAQLREETLENAWIRRWPAAHPTHQPAQINAAHMGNTHRSGQRPGRSRGLDRCSSSSWNGSTDPSEPMGDTDEQRRQRIGHSRRRSPGSEDADHDLANTSSERQRKPHGAPLAKSWDPARSNSCSGSSDMADTLHSGLGTRGIGEGSASDLVTRREAVADTASHRWDEGRPESEGIERRSDTTECSSTMADAPSKRQPWRINKRCDGGEECPPIGGDRQPMADADSVRQLQPEGSEPGIWRRPRDHGESMADADSSDMRHEWTPGSTGRAAEARTRVNAADLPLFPPGPAAEVAWIRILEQRPDLAPAIDRPVKRVGGGADADDDQSPQPDIRGLVDGIAPRLDLTRAERLRAGGNGVVPIQAAAAFIILARRARLIRRINFATLQRL